ncbi:MAG: hypothetical protein ACOY3N_23515 [Bradyrhizobium sp.]|uniref:hypothetical protein n=1 Tax=Bradyrhizobium sp. TaxID=376 RepID=UPI003BF145BB
MTAKSHALKTRAQWPRHEESVTFCGKRGVFDCASEYITTDGRDARFEVISGGEKPTCARCRASWAPAQNPRTDTAKDGKR